MAQKLYNDTAVQDIADAIREKNGEPATTKYKIAEMGDAIRAIPGGGGKPEITDGRYFFVNGARNDIADDVKFVSSATSGESFSMRSMFLNNKASDSVINSILNDEDNTFHATELFSTFQNCFHAVSLNLSRITVASYNNDFYYSTFNGCTSLKTIVSPPKSASKSFYYCFSRTGLEHIDVDAFCSDDYTGFVENAQSMFSGSQSLKTINLTKDIFRNPSSSQTATNLSYMFQNCTGLDTLELGVKIPTNNISYMFYNCSNITEIKIPKLLRSNLSASTYTGMFYGCTKLKKIELRTTESSWGTQGFNTQNMFNGCSALETVIIDLPIVFRASGSTFFTGVPTTCKFYVPDALVSAYKTATNWSSRAAYIFPLSEYVEP